MCTPPTSSICRNLWTTGRCTAIEGIEPGHIFLARTFPGLPDNGVDLDSRHQLQAELYHAVHLVTDPSDDTKTIGLIIERLDYKSDASAPPDTPRYHIYGDQLVVRGVTDPDAAVSEDRQRFLRFSENILRPNAGDFVNCKVDPSGRSVWDATFDRCPVGCDKGYLRTPDRLKPLLPLENVSRLGNFRPLCPVCFGTKLVGRHLDMRRSRERGESIAPRRGLPRKPYSTVAAEQVKCPVCQERFELDTVVVELPCWHVICDVGCIDWLRYRNSCPVCRYRVDGTPKQKYEDPGQSWGEPTSDWNDLVGDPVFTNSETSTSEQSTAVNSPPEFDLDDPNIQPSLSSYLQAGVGGSSTASSSNNPIAGPSTAVNRLPKLGTNDPDSEDDMCARVPAAASRSSTTAPTHSPVPSSSIAVSSAAASTMLSQLPKDHPLEDIPEDDVAFEDTMRARVRGMSMDMDDIPMLRPPGWLGAGSDDEAIEEHDFDRRV